MTKKIRLIDEEPATETEASSGAFTAEEKELLLKYAEAIDWKMWEILKLLKDKAED